MWIKCEYGTIMILKRSSTWINTCASCTLITTNPIWIGLESNPRLPPYRDSRCHVQSEKNRHCCTFLFCRKVEIFSVRKEFCIYFYDCARTLPICSMDVAAALSLSMVHTSRRFLLFTTFSWNFIECKIICYPFLYLLNVMLAHFSKVMCLTTTSTGGTKGQSVVW